MQVSIFSIRVYNFRNIIKVSISEILLVRFSLVIIVRMRNSVCEHVHGIDEDQEQESSKTSRGRLQLS